jgi:hypothetical protein
LTPIRRLALGAGIVALGLGLVAGRGTRAAPLEASWDIVGRANVSSFAPSVSQDPAATGYEIVSFDAVDVQGGLSTYVYGGADLPANRGGAAPAIVTCEATFTQTEIQLQVGGAFPYAGCVFFLRVTNTGDGPLNFQLGGLTADADVECNAPGCLASDIQVLAGSDSSTPEDACTVNGDLTSTGGLLALAPGGASPVPCSSSPSNLRKRAPPTRYTLLRRNFSPRPNSPCRNSRRHCSCPTSLRLPGSPPRPPVSSARRRRPGPSQHRRWPVSVHPGLP